LINFENIEFVLNLICILELVPSFTIERFILLVGLV